MPCELFCAPGATLDQYDKAAFLDCLDWTSDATGDNEPPAGAVASSDYEVVTSLSWTFGP